MEKNSNKKALCITGARQVGKTTLIREFVKSNYKNFIEINFLTTPKAKTIFDSNLDADTIFL